MSTPDEWVEVTMPSGEPDVLLHEVAIPLLTAGDVVSRGLFLRDLGSRPLVLQVCTAPGADLDARLNRLSDHQARTGPVTTVPLRGAVFTGPELGSRTRELLATITPTLIDILNTGAKPVVLARALDLMTAHLSAVSPAESGPPRSFLSFRSHAEAFMASSRDPAATRTALDQRYDTVADAVCAQVAAILEQARVGDPITSAPAQAWHDTVRAAKPALEQAFRDGRIVAQTEYAGDHLRERDDFAGSQFHRAAGASQRLQRFLSTDPSFLATRLLTSVLYLSLHNIGVSLAERYFLCHAISRACESIFDVDSMDVLADITS